MKNLQMVHTLVLENRLGKNTSQKKGTNLFLPQEELKNQQFVQRMQRFYFRLPITYGRLSMNNGKPVVGPTKRIIIQDISCSGIGLLSTRPLPADQIIHLVMNDTIPYLQGPLIAHVVRCAEKGKGWFTVGAQLHKVRSEDFIETL